MSTYTSSTFRVNEIITVFIGVCGGERWNGGDNSQGIFVLHRTKLADSDDLTHLSKLKIKVISQADKHRRQFQQKTQCRIFCWLISVKILSKAICIWWSYITILALTNYECFDYQKSIQIEFFFKTKSMLIRISFCKCYLFMIT